MTPVEQLRKKVKEIREIVENLRLVGVGVGGSVNNGFSVRRTNGLTDASDDAATGN